MAKRFPTRHSARLVWDTKPGEQLWPGEVISHTEEMVIPRPNPCLYQQEQPKGSRDPNRLFYGDNLLAMQELLSRGYEGKVDLIYIDPPFYSQANYTHRVTPGGPDAGGELPVIERLAYQDTWSGGMDAYLDMLYPRLQLMKRLLARDGSIYVHLDASISHYIKVIMDEIFGPDSFQREIIWRIGWISGYKSAVRNWVRNHDTLLFYVKNPARFTFNKEYVPYPPGYRRRGHQETTGKGYPLEDVWNASPAEFALKGEDSLDSIQIKSFSREKTGFATQKNISLLRRIIGASSNPGDLVADFFCGSGTTLVVAEKLGRRWLGCEMGRTGIQVTRKRLVAAGALHFWIERVRPAPRPDSNTAAILTAPNIELVTPAPGSDINPATGGDCAVQRTHTEPLPVAGKVAFTGKGGEVGINKESHGGQPLLRLTRPEVIRLAGAGDQEQVSIGLEHYTMPGPVGNPLPCKTKAAWENLIACARQNFTVLIDYWAVDWDYDGRCFRSQWQAWKGYNKNETIPARATALLQPKRPRTIAVQVVDILGNEVVVTATVL